MPDRSLAEFLLLDPEEQRDVYATAAAETGLPSKILEKDVWICWTLDVLFSIEPHPSMAFKGGTSLSKVYGAINRFSEDIDVTMDLDPEREGAIPTSRNGRDRLREDLAALLEQHLAEVVVPAFVTPLGRYVIDPENHVVMTDAETIVIDYPSAYPKIGDYVAERVKVEFGARNMVTPQERHEVRPYVAPFILDYSVTLPVATIDVLSAERTFWEKATLAHDECNRSAFTRDTAARISRHWYDLARLSEHPIAPAALGDAALLGEVVAVKTAFYARGTSHYDDCLAGKIRLVPDDAGLAALRADYAEMVAAGMFQGEAPPFDWVIDRVTALEETIRARTG